MSACECCGGHEDVVVCLDVDDPDVAVLLCADCRSALAVRDVNPN